MAITDKSTAGRGGGMYAQSTFYHMEKVLTGMMLATGGSDETGWKPGLFKAQLCSGGMPDGPCLAKVDEVRSGPKEIKFPKRTILVNINTLYSISYNAFFETRGP